jgi:pyruvate ferredoxin oxidoreductase delta subunit
VITRGEEYDIDYKYCKGCGICAEECPLKVIEMVEE